VVCYDDFYDETREIANKILNGLRTVNHDHIKTHALCIYDAFLKVIVWEYDRALWLFRKPVRRIEKVNHHEKPALFSKNSPLMENQIGSKGVRKKSSKFG
jgi:hypothetical protein